MGFEVNTRRGAGGLAGADVKLPVVLWALDGRSHDEAAGQMDALVGAFAIGGEIVAVGGSVEGVGVLAMVEADHVFFLDIVHAAYPGVAPALSDLVGGQIHMMFATSVAATPLMKSGRLLALAVTTAQRSAAASDLPTMQESGLADFEATTWHGLVVPAHTPASIIGRLNAATLSALHRPSVANRLAGLGVEVVGGTPLEFSHYINAESTKWGDVIRRAGIRIG